ncbi:MAG: hypothetical protein K0S35_3924 [Geminicoccaceae bacterium]|nr:hypothetical protein [Geminicoccaceae bacterium]
MWPITSASASSTTSASISPEPGIEGPPVWIVLWMPYLRAQATICLASSPRLTPPSPTSPSSLTPASAMSLKSSSTMPCSSTGAPACSLTPPGRKFENARCAVIASALTPTTSLGRPGRWTSPAEIMVVTPPWRKLSIQFSWLWRGVQSPNTGWTWLSIRPGATVVPLAFTTTSASPMSTSWAKPTSRIRPSIATIVSASSSGCSSAPESSVPMFLTTSLPRTEPSSASFAMGVAPARVSASRPCPRSARR